MSEELNDEVVSINSIYGDETLQAASDNSAIYILTLPSQVSVSLRLEFSSDYPDAPPSILGTHHIGDNVAKGEGSYLVDLAREVLAQVYTPGAPCIFDLVEEIGQKLQLLNVESSSAKDKDPQDAKGNGQLDPTDEAFDRGSDDAQDPTDSMEPPPWIMSEVVTEKKSIFIARAVAATSVLQAKNYLAHLLATDKKVAKATHNITAWRIRGDNGVQYQDCDDDGETAAGGRLLHLLELMNVTGVMVVVSRWYGGVQLGPDRFRIINQTAREAIVKGEFLEKTPSTNDAGKDEEGPAVRDMWHKKGKRGRLL
ncbi:hypothetical protein LTR62_008554 [Meristemomyces frigidus]|uniref:RWD domain-containing protein n=1 Tax=Meristemomyces frigidus TaxID=1508187 RepID=A0AAN7TH67_9PEZI|nr:hypothetical protein LTR62_008554 [Meristemomyces frigidus]